MARFKCSSRVRQEIRVHPCSSVIIISRVKIITDERCTRYESPGHPERPARVAQTAKQLRAQKDLPIEWAKPSRAEDVPILRAHKPEFLARLKIPRDFDADTAYHKGIDEIARLGVGAALDALKYARAGETVFSLMRPPAHHATQDQAMGFCYLNGVAIAVLEAGLTGAKRMAVFDFDVHHGNGTEAILLNKPNVAFYSIHQSPCYPGTGTEDVGNNCFNFPVRPYTPRQEYRKILTRALEALKKIKPDVVAVSAGFDAYARDPIAQETLEAEDYYWLGQEIRKLEATKFSLLEGGYSDELPELIFAYLKGLNGL